MAKDLAETFRTKVRVKGVTAEAVSSTSGAHEPRPIDRRASLMEALKQANPVPPAASKTRVENEPVRPRAPRPAAAAARWEPEPSEPETPRRFRRPPRTRVGRLAAAKLRQLQRLKEAAASLESLTRGEVEEATVEIVRRDRKPVADNHRPPFLGPKV